MQEIDLGNLTLTPWTRYEGFETEEAFAAHLEVGLEDDGAAGFVSALKDVAIARLISQLAESTGIDRSELCLAFADRKALDDASIAKLVSAVMAPELAQELAPEPARELAHA